MAFFGVPLSGLIASQDQLSSVSNNLANLDTVGYKDQTVSFSDLFAQSSLVNASNNPIQTGLGVLPSQTSSDFTDGGTTTTGVDTNMALTGNGLFVVQSTSGAISYTRAGDFTTNAAGYLTTPNGELVMGYAAADGSTSTSSVLQPIQVGLGSVIPAVASSQFQVPANLSSSSAVGATYSTPVTVYDSLGGNHVLTVNYDKTASNTWSYSVTMPSSDLASGTAGSTTPTVLTSGSLQFDSSGNLAQTFDAAGNSTNTTDAAGVSSPATSIAVDTNALSDGAAAINLTWNLSTASGGAITQTNLASSPGSATQNGEASGTLSSISVLSDGTIEGVYSNQTSTPIGQVAVATFANEQGLLRTGGNDYQATVGSGAAAVGVAGTGGRGVITGGSTESSNVDVAAEFSKMIVAQQAYQANAKTITTFQQISQATIQMIST